MMEKVIFLPGQFSLLLQLVIQWPVDSDCRLWPGLNQGSFNLKRKETAHGSFK